MPLPPMVVSDADIPGEQTIADVDWHASVTKLSNLVSAICGQPFEINYHIQDDGSIAFSGRGFVGPTAVPSSAEQRAEELCRQLDEWLIFRTDSD